MVALVHDEGSSASDLEDRAFQRRVREETFCRRALPGFVALLTLFEGKGDVVFLDQAMERIAEARAEDPCAVIVEALDGGLLVADLWFSHAGLPFRSVVLRRA